MIARLVVETAKAVNGSKPMRNKIKRQAMDSLAFFIPIVIQCCQGVDDYEICIDYRSKWGHG